MSLPSRTVAVAVTLFVGLFCGLAEPIVVASESPSGPIENFSLRDHRGEVNSLAGLADKELVVVAFLGTECPLAKLYGGRLNELQREYGDHSVAVIGVNSNRQDSLSELTEYVNQHGIRFPLLKDPEALVADAFGASRTPQVFLLDRDRVIRYSGAIDDRYGIGYQKEKPDRTYLVDAVNALLAGEAVAVEQTNTVGCVIGRVAPAEAKEAVTFNKHIAPIFNQHCVECHREGEVAPFPMTTYDDVLGWGEMIVEVTAEERMPPWYADPKHGRFKNDARLSDHEKRLIKQWVTAGSPMGDPADQPDSPEFAKGWRIPQPSQVIRMADKPFSVPAEGVVDYQYYVVDPKWTEDKYVVAAEARPDNRSVVHHIIAYLVPPGMDLKKQRPRAMLVGYAPGATPNVLAEGSAVLAPAGSKLLFEMHYTPNGSAQSDLSYIGVSFTEKENVKRLVKGRAAINNKFTIPPGAENHRVTAGYQSKQDELLLRMTPHMHLRGSSFRYEAIYPDGGREVLLEVPRYDFNWQLSYELAKPKRLPRGTEILCTAHFDNSESNPANPNPTAEVRWGEQSWNEMMIGFFEVVKDDGEAVPRSASAGPTQTR